MLRRGEIVLLLIAALVWGAGSASAATLNVGTCVPGGFTTISAAVAAASAGDIVSVCPGTYPEIVTIDKNLTLIGKTPSPGSFATVTYPSSPGLQCTGPIATDCPQILVENATAQVQHLHIDGSQFAYATATPVGIMFFNASGGAQYNTIENEMSTCISAPAYGVGILTVGSLLGFTLQATGNYIDNFGNYGIFVNAQAGNLTNNMIGEDTDNNYGIYFFASKGSSALNNTLWGTGTVANQLGIYVNASPSTSLVRNSISDIYNGIEIDNNGGSSLTANGLTDAFRGITLFCTDNNKLTSNSVSDQPSVNGNYGVNIQDCEPTPGSDNNLLNGNSFNGLCTGILTGSAANTGNTFINNTFSNITEMNIMPGNNCP